jgi:plastocyanin domain-containing protein
MTTWFVNIGGILLIALIIWWFWLSPKGSGQRSRETGGDDH